MNWNPDIYKFNECPFKNGWKSWFSYNDSDIEFQALSGSTEVCQIYIPSAAAIYLEAVVVWRSVALAALNEALKFSLDANSVV